MPEGDFKQADGSTFEKILLHNEGIQKKIPPPEKPRKQMPQSRKKNNIRYPKQSTARAQGTNLSPVVACFGDTLGVVGLNSLVIHDLYFSDTSKLS